MGEVSASNSNSPDVMARACGPTIQFRSVGAGTDNVSSLTSHLMIIRVACMRGL